MVGFVTRSHSRNVASAGEPADTTAARMNVQDQAWTTPDSETKQHSSKMVNETAEEMDLKTKKKPTIRIEACNISCPE